MLRLRTLGGLSLGTDGERLVGAATQRRPLALLAVLAAAGERGVSRDRLQALLWPESDAERARKVLTQTVYALRRDLGDPAVVLGTTELRLNPELVAADVTEFEHAAGSREWERAALLYTGPFLDGVHPPDAPEFERWTDAERDRLHRCALDAIERLARDAEARAEWEVAVQWWRRRAALDPLSGRVAARLMEALVAAGDTSSALRHARVHQTLLREELGAPPDPAVAALVERLRTPDRPATPVSPTPVPVKGAPPPPSGAPRPDTAVASNGTSPVGGPAGLDDPALPRGPARPLTAPTGSPVAGEPRADAPAAPGRRVRWWWGAAGGVAVAAAATFGAVLLARHHAGSAPDRALVVVAPFDVADRELQLWREGMVDVLSRNLDGAGPLHTVAPTRVVRAWTGRADRETVRAFARTLGTGTAVFGGLMRAGADSVRASVTVLDVASGRSLLEVGRQEPVTRMDRLTDSLTVDVLRAVGRVVPVRAARMTTVGAAGSLEALRAFLRGEQFYRRAQWDSAVAHYHHATTLDSTLALAWRRLGLVASWQRLQQDSLAAAYLLRAGATNRGLGPRDSLLVAADSLAAAASTTSSVVAAFGLARRLFATLDTAVRRYPDDPEVWFALGEARYHFGFGPVVGVSERATLDAFDRAIALDSAFAPAYIHAVELGFNLGGAPLGLRYARAYLALGPTEAAHRGVLLVEPLADARRAHAPEVTHLLDTARTSALVSARTTLRRWPDPAETAVRLGRLLAAGRPSEYPLFRDTAFMRRRLAEQLAFRGHLAEAARVLGVRDAPLLGELAYLDAVPAHVAQAAFSRWARDGSGLARLALPWWSARRDTASLGAFLRRAGARETAAGDADEAARSSYDSASALAHLALARGDTAAALRRFLALPDTLCPECYLDRLTRARLLAAADRTREALATLDEPLVAFLTPVEVVFALERARVARLAGDRRVGDAACRFARAAWARADAPLRRTVGAACPEPR